MDWDLLDELHVPDLRADIELRAVSGAAPAPVAGNPRRWWVTAAAILIAVGVVGAAGAWLADEGPEVATVASSTTESPHQGDEPSGALPFCRGPAPTALAAIGIETDVEVSGEGISLQVRNVGTVDVSIIVIGALSPLDSRGWLAAGSPIPLNGKPPTTLGPGEVHTFQATAQPPVAVYDCGDTGPPTTDTAGMVVEPLIAPGEYDYVFPVIVLADSPTVYISESITLGISEDGSYSVVG